jgi:hypothetical protein
MWAALAQLVEHRIRNAGVRGSNPLSGTSLINGFTGLLAEHANSRSTKSPLDSVETPYPLPLWRGLGECLRDDWPSPILVT